MVDVKLSDPDKIITTKIADDKINSYDIIALVDLNDPKNAYFEFALQPDSKINKNIKAKIYFGCVHAHLMNSPGMQELLFLWSDATLR